MSTGQTGTGPQEQTNFENRTNLKTVSERAKLKTTAELDKTFTASLVKRYSLPLSAKMFTTSRSFVYKLLEASPIQTTQKKILPNSLSILAKIALLKVINLTMQGYFELLPTIQSI
ncbi:hypothetical protein CEXT_378731 [Caerostris extrusa]|uniref:Uncharacterized protein n=1 Tax=Caerostris extrusa TaxID=172846 RepID=A0AAV4UYM8_CAEEX|nr:hypothetical protein CEXT_378731 [Caerostris extrusa]